MGQELHYEHAANVYPSLDIQEIDIATLNAENFERDKILTFKPT